MVYFVLLEVLSLVFSKEFIRIGKKLNVYESILLFLFILGVFVNGVEFREILILKGVNEESFVEFDRVNNVFYYGLLLFIILLFFMFRVGRKLVKLLIVNIYIILVVCSGFYIIMMIVMNMIFKF